MVLKGQDAWRKHPLISQQWKKPFPGLGTACCIFAVYLACDYFYNSMNYPKIDHTRSSQAKELRKVEAKGYEYEDTDKAPRI